MAEVAALQRFCGLVCDRRMAALQHALGNGNKRNRNHLGTQEYCVLTLELSETRQTEPVRLTARTIRLHNTIILSRYDIVI